ncbi:MAG TPA: PQQ-dependent sugar dehydrogenase [Terriglobales bacterium]|nr:PQQ-dependent sugar dehydrogenase [Terriglobales bacterium]
MPGRAGATVVPTGFADLRPLVTAPRPALQLPVGMAFLPDRRLLVIEQKSAKIRLFVDNTLAVIDPVVTLPDVNTAGGEQGLLGIAVDPGWPARPYLYIHCDDAAGPHVRISRYTASGELVMVQDGHLTVDPATRYDLLNDAPDAAPVHNGGTLRFGPDGMLYASLGDDLDHCAAQDSSALVGKILRLDVSRLPSGAGGPAPRALITPSGNPFASAPDSNARLVWAEGLRNPFRFGFDPLDGALFVGDAGEATWEEIDRAAQGGRNFGWPLLEGPAPFAISCPNPLLPGDAPIYAYNRAGTAAVVIGGCVYRRPARSARGFPASYEGDSFFGDYYLGFLRRLHGSGNAWALAAPEDGQPSATDWGQGFANVSEWQVGPDGGLWYCLQTIAFPGTEGDVREIVARVDTSVTPPAPPAASFARARPTPARGSAELLYTLTVAARVALRVYDTQGRLVRTLLTPRIQSPNAYSVPWDGRDGEGREVRPGLYIARLEVNDQRLAQRVPLLR